MSEFLGWFVHHPLRILALAALYLAIWGLLRQARSPARRADALLVPAVFCVVFAGWEWWVTTATPEANIRVDLLLAWPILLVLTAWSLYRAFRS